MRVRQVFAVAAVALWLLAVPGAVLGSGWVIEATDPDFPGDRTTFFFSNGKVRVEGLVEGLVFLVNLEAGEGYIVDEGVSRYGGGKIENIVEAVVARWKDEAGEEKEEEEESNSGPPAAMPQVRFERVSGGETVAGFATEHYRVFLEDLLVEELWLAPEIGAVTSGAGGSLFSMLDAMTGGGDGEREGFPPGYEEQGPYRELLRTGYAVRKITYYRKEESRVEVVSAARQDLSPELFSIPPGMAEARYLKVFFGKK
jgi:hypothetical protein